MSTARPGALDVLKSLIGRRPAETTTAAAGAVGLLLATSFDGDDEVTTALVILLSVLPAIVSYSYNVGHGGVRSWRTEIETDLEHLALRALRRARVGDPRWKSDVNAVKKITQALPSVGDKQRADSPAPPPQQGSGSKPASPP